MRAFCGRAPHTARRRSTAKRSWRLISAQYDSAERTLTEGRSPTERHPWIARLEGISLLIRMLPMKGHSSRLLFFSYGKWHHGTAGFVSSSELEGDIGVAYPELDNYPGRPSTGVHMSLPSLREIRARGETPSRRVQSNGFPALVCSPFRGGAITAHV